MPGYIVELSFTTPGHETSSTLIPLWDVPLPDYGSPHEPSPLIVAMNAGADPDGSWVRPGEGEELWPPALDHEANIEAKHEGHRDQLGVVLAVEHHWLKDGFAWNQRSVKRID